MLMMRQQPWSGFRSNSLSLADFRSSLATRRDKPLPKYLCEGSSDSILKALMITAICCVYQGMIRLRINTTKISAFFMQYSFITKAPHY